MKGIFRSRRLHFAIMTIIISVSMFLYQMITVQGESTDPKFIMFRLEDIGPGGQYATPEGLGKLRAVLEYLEEQGVIYHLAVIPKWISFGEDGVKVERSLDQSGDAYIDTFNQMLKRALQSGAVLGMHGYTHQTGDTVREDGHQDSGIGNEFDVAGKVETSTTAFAEERVREGIKTMKRAGLQPTFWEAPHYHTTAEQDKVFRSYFGMNYQANVQLDPRAPHAQYSTHMNVGYGASSSGAVYVPTPYSYIPYNRDEQIILDQLGKGKSVPSFFYHAFLEFKQLIPVTDRDGEPVMRDGIPEFRYPASPKTQLQKLINEIRKKGYKFYTIHDYVPFTPAHSAPISNLPGSLVQAGDVTGDGQGDVVTWNKANGTISVTSGKYKGMRNEAGQPTVVWGNAPYKKGSALTLCDLNQDGKKDLVIGSQDGSVTAYSSSGSSFEQSAKSGAVGGSWHNLRNVKLSDGSLMVVGESSDRMKLQGAIWKENQWTSVKPFTLKQNELRDILVMDNAEEGQKLFLYRKGQTSGADFTYDVSTHRWKIMKTALPVPNEPGEWRTGDFNGDGKQDLLRWSTLEGKYAVYLRNTSGQYTYLSSFGPWDRGATRLFITDFDGNGKDDIAVIPSGNGTLDLALSYETKTTPEIDL